MSDNDKDVKSIEQAIDLTVQARAREDGQGHMGIALLPWLSMAGQIIPPWWSKRRDEELRRFVKQSDHMTGAKYTLTAKLTSVPVRAEPRDPSVKAHRKQAEVYTQLLVEGSDFGAGWIESCGKWLNDLWNQDNGAFWEIIGEGIKDTTVENGGRAGPIVGPAVGIAHLDSWRCNRTGNPEFPVVYTDTDGSRYKLHRSRVAFASQLPSSIAEMFGVGFCAISRAINTAQHLIDIGVYEQEKLGSRPLRQLGITGGGLDPLDVAAAIAEVSGSLDAAGLSRYSKTALVGDSTIPDATLALIDLISTPDGFDKQISTTLGMFAIALAFAVPPRWLWPASVTGATKADAMFQHIAGIGGGAGQTLRLITLLLGGSERGDRHITGKFLPPHLKLVFDFQDDEQDRMKSEIVDTRSQTHERDVNSGIVSIRVAREQMLSDGDITDAQFRQMELNDGRLPEGVNVLVLFESDDDIISELLFLGVDNPLDVEANDNAEMIKRIDDRISLTGRTILTVSNANQRQKAEQALAALERLRTLYEGNNVAEQMIAPETEEEETEEETETETKAGVDDFGLSIRSAIRGLWSGQTDRFNFVDSMFSAIRRGFTRAWTEGAKECGIAFDELTEAERQMLDDAINSQVLFMPRFADEIVANSKANGGKLTPLLVRGQDWLNRYNQIFNTAKANACGNQKLEWILGAAEHCTSCLKLAGKIKRASFWVERGILPRVAGADYLECAGYRCQCSLRQTDRHGSPGPLPNLP